MPELESRGIGLLHRMLCYRLRRAKPAIVVELACDIRGPCPESLFDARPQ